LKKRLKELKLRAGLETYRHIPIEFRSKAGKDDFKQKLEERKVCGYLCSWGNKNLHEEIFVKGCCAKSISERGPKSSSKYKITFLWQHHQDDPLALFAVLEEDDYGLYFETAPLDDVPNADRCLKQIKSGTLNQFSMGFDYVYDRIEYDDANDAIVLLEIILFEGSVVTIASDMNTYALRNVEQIIELHDEIEDFVLTLPRKDRAQARQLFTRQKALIDLEPFTSNEETLKEDKPETEQTINWDLIINNI
jgi:HK97 family phage prohead protease